jgi:hypothetical protein
MQAQQVLWGLFFYQKLDRGAMNLQKSGLCANLVQNRFGIKTRRKLGETVGDPSGVLDDLR